MGMKLGASFLFFLSSASLNDLATTCIRFGVSWYALQQTGSAAIFAAMIGVSSLVEVYSKPLLAPLADYFDRFRVFRACIALATVFGVALTLAAFLLPFSAPLLTLLLVALSLVGGLRDPTTAALIPSLVSPDKLTEAQSIRSTANSVVTIGGPILAGAVLALAGARFTLATAATVTSLSFLCTYGVRERSMHEAARATSWGHYLRTWHHRTVDGLRSVWMNDAERKIAIATALVNAGLFPFVVVILPVWVSQNLGGNAATMASIEVSLGLGILVGSAMLIGMVNARIGRHAAVIGGTCLIGASIMLGSQLTSLSFILICLFLCGVGVSLYLINTMTLRSAATPANFRARSTAGVGFLSQCIHPFAIQGYGVVMAHYGAPTAGALCGLVIFSSLFLLLSNKDAKKLWARPNEEIVGIYGQMFPNAFVERKVNPHA
jgi:MFS transporter, DHA3 family, macrolide efflux protein